MQGHSQNSILAIFLKHITIASYSQSYEVSQIFSPVKTSLEISRCQVPEVLTFEDRLKFDSETSKEMIGPFDLERGWYTFEFETSSTDGGMGSSISVGVVDKAREMGYGVGSEVLATSQDSIILLLTGGTYYLNIKNLDNSCCVYQVSGKFKMNPG